ncbi:hypothetical protein LTR67_009016 [Exophiala xenobiotica]
MDDVSKAEKDGSEVCLTEKFKRSDQPPSRPVFHRPRNDQDELLTRGRKVGHRDSHDANAQTPPTSTAAHRAYAVGCMTG